MATSADVPPVPTAAFRRWASAYATTVVRLRWVVVLVWGVLLVAAHLWLPDAPGAVNGGGLEGLVSGDSAAVRTEVRSYREFQLPLLSRTAVVQRDPAGLDVSVQAEAVVRAAALTAGRYDDTAPIVAAVPVPNTFGLFPGSREAGTTVITWLFMPPSLGFGGQYTAGQRFAERHFDADDRVAGVIGSVPARVEQGRVVQRALPTVEVVTLALVLVIVGLVFRSLVAPLLTLVVAGVGVAMTLQLADAAGALVGVSVPSELEPLLVALLLGVATDYVVFFLSGMRGGVAAGLQPATAARDATARFVPIVMVAGLTVASGTGCLLVARSRSACITSATSWRVGRWVRRGWR